MTTVNYTYTIGSAKFTSSAEVEEDWADMNESQREDFLYAQALEEVEDQLAIEDVEVNDEGDDETE